jgi:quercetin dioxygenase-like cupin family protein
VLTLQESCWHVPPGELPITMHASDATAKPLLKSGEFGADLIRFPAGGSVADHTHAGDHMLFVVSGVGWVDYDGSPHRLEPGVCYLIPGEVRHGVRAETELTMLAVAARHIEVESVSRLRLCE